MIAIPGPRDAIESTAPSSSASTVARGIQVWAAHPPEALQGRRQQMQGRAAERGDPQRPADRVRATGSAAIPRHLFDIVEKSPRLEGVMVRNYYDLAAESEEFRVPQLRSGAVVPDVTVVDGFERTVAGFLGMLRGENTGKMLIRIAD